jgi:hypothetical protein
MPLTTQLLWLTILALPVASIAWTFTHEEVLREAREYCQRKSERCRALWQRKFFYLFTCEYCLSHYVAAFFVWLAGFTMLFSDWRGYLISWFAVVWMANLFMSLFGRLRLDIKRERVEIKGVEAEVKEKTGEKKAACFIPIESIRHGSVFAISGPSPFAPFFLRKDCGCSR